MNVPISQRTIQTDAPGVVTPRIEPITDKAFGADIGAAKAQLGNTVVSGAAKLSAAIAERQNFDREQAVHDALQPIAKQMYDYTHGVNGAAIRQGLQARGATSEADSIFGNDPSVKGSNIRTEALKKFSKDPEASRLFSKLYDATWNNYREAILSNEARQIKVADEQGLSSAVATAAQSAASNPKYTSPFDDPAFKTSSNRKYEFNASVGGDEYAKLKQQEDNDTLFKETLKVDPAKAVKIDPAKLSPEGQAILRGARLDYFTTQIQNGAANMVHADGTSDLARQENYASEQAKKLGMSSEEIPHVMAAIRSSASAHDQQLKDSRDSVTRKFYNDAITQKQNGMSYEDASEMLKRGGYSYDPKDLEDKQKWLLGLYTKDTSIYSQMMDHWTKEQKVAYEQIKDSQELADKYPLPKDQQRYMDNFLQQMLEQHLSSPNDMRQLFKNDMESIPTGGKWLYFFNDEAQKSDVVMDLQKSNMVLVGLLGIDKSLAISKEMGGAANLADDTPEGKAAILLAQKGYPVNKDNIVEVVRQWNLKAKK